MRPGTPHALNQLKVRLNILLGQFLLASLKTGNGVPLDHVRQFTGHHDLLPVLCLSLGGGERCVRLRRVLLAVRGVIALQLGRNLLAGGPPAGCQAAQQVPPQVRINFQAVEGDRPVEEVLHVLVLFSGAGLVNERLHQLQLRIRIRFCRLHQLPQPVGCVFAGLVPKLGVHERA